MSQQVEQEQYSERYAVLPLKDVVAFPDTIIPLFVGRAMSVAAVDRAHKQSDRIVLLAQKESATDNLSREDLYSVGTIAEIIQVSNLPNGTMKVLLNVLCRVVVKKLIFSEEVLEAEVSPLEDYASDNEEIASLRRSVLDDFTHYASINKKIPPDVVSSISQIMDASLLLDRIALQLDISVHTKQEILEASDLAERFDLVARCLLKEIGIVDAEHLIRNRVRRQIEKTQKEYYLNEQMKAIQKELGLSSTSSLEQLELRNIEKKIRSTKFSKEAREKALFELKKLGMMNQISAEAGIVRGYLDWLLALPWGVRTSLKGGLMDAKDILDKNHYGMNEVKERILECLAVQQRAKKHKGTAICLVGPPGVGKTSLARSFAKATGRKFTQMSLGGVRDEAEIRGHRKTYIGSMPGKIIQCIKKAGSSNPLFLLDEIDKMASDFRGDPASALLEVLDFEHNHTFVDHYLEIEYDLSEVMFLTTANNLADIPRPLLDRMEVIRVPGYMEAEKMQIAMDYLFPKQKQKIGLHNDELEIKQGAMSALITSYTKEAGVRNLEREIAKIARKSLKKILFDKSVTSIMVTEENLAEFCGVPKYSYGTVSQRDLVGVVNGLAYTEVGGDLLAIESIITPGEGQIKCTGKLGEVMQESAQAAFSYALSYLASFGLSNVLQKCNVHVHVPEAATPKDGPSAGIALCSSILSLLLNIPAKSSVAMTGEITLSGRVLAIGGLKEKLMGAIRGGASTVIIPKDNEKNLSEIPEDILKCLNIVAVERMGDVLVHVFGNRFNAAVASRHQQDSAPQTLLVN